MKKDKNIKERILPFIFLLFNNENKRKKVTKKKNKDTITIEKEEVIEQEQVIENAIIQEEEIHSIENIQEKDISNTNVKETINNPIETNKKIDTDINTITNTNTNTNTIINTTTNTISNEKESKQDSVVTTIVGLMTLLEKDNSNTKIKDDKKENTTTSLLSQDEKIHLAIIEEIKEYIDDDLKEIDELAYKINTLKDKEKDEVLLEEVEKIKKELEELIKRVEELRIKYEKVYDKLKIQDISVIDNSILEMSIKDYIESTKDGKDTTEFFNKIEEIVEYLDILNKLVEVDKEKDELQVNVDEKIDKFEERDQDFEEALDSKVNIEDINRDIEKYNETVKKALDELEKRMANSSEINTRIETTTRRALNFGRIIAATILLAQTPRIPPTPRGIFLRAGLIGVAIHLLLNSVYTETTTRTINTVTYIDFKNEILNNKELLTESLKLIGNSNDELQQIKKMFEEEFEEYANDIPEYKELLKNIIELEKELQRQEEKANEYTNELDEKLKLNNEKIKTLEDYAS